METLKFVTAILSLITALIGISTKIKTLKFKNMDSEHLIYYVLLAAFFLFVAAVCYLAKIHIRR